VRDSLESSLDLLSRLETLERQKNGPHNETIFTGKKGGQILKLKFC
jgi:hypothetical protein